MAHIDVQIARAESCLGVLAEKKQLLYDSNGDLERDLNKIVQNWESNGMDRESYVTELQSQVKKMNELTRQLGELDRMVKQHIEELRLAAARTIN